MSTIAYYGTKISDNLITSPDGGLICRSAVLARTGFQKYYLGEIPRKLKQDVGITGDDRDTINLYRDPSDVFSKRALASAEGRPVTNNHPSDGKLLDNVSTTYDSCGHVQNVRKSSRPLASGDWGLIGDLIIHEQNLIEAILEKGKRELSMGYTYLLTKRNNQICMTDLIFNHCAVCDAGRAEVASIVDALPETDPYLAQLELIRDVQTIFTLKNQKGIPPCQLTTSI